jgi:hypothetical protein
MDNKKKDIYSSKIKDLKNIYIKPSLGLTMEDLYGISKKEVKSFNKQIDKNRKK